MLLDKQNLAKRLGISRPTLDQWVAQGLPVASSPATNRRQGYKFCTDAVDGWLAARKQQRAAQQPSLENRIFAALYREFWALARSLWRPEDLAIIRHGCRTPADLIRAGFRTGRSIGLRLEELEEQLFEEFSNER